METLEKKKIGRPVGKGIKKVPLKALLDTFKIDTMIPIPHTFGREFGLIEDEVPEEKSFSEALFD
tara:strand:- start:128 stop:322 length:195 start_codon:yes stop_codon:yes gene_type:complete